jgi:VWFA-related protein
MKSSVLILGCAFLLLPGLSETAQEPQAKPNRSDDAPVFHKDVNLVQVLFTVRDKHGSLVPNLAQDQFQVVEEGKPQEIKYFSAENNVPLTLGLLIDSSESTQSMLPQEKAASADFLAQALRPGDLAFVISFDINVDLQQDVTSEPSRLRQGLERAATHKPLSRRVSGESSRVLRKTTALYDAVYLGGNEVLQQAGRKVMVVVTTGVDQGSKLRLGEALKAAQQADAVCYVLMLINPLYGNDMVAMQQLTEQTGGRVIQVIDPGKLSKAFAQVSEELHSQYSLGYRPIDEKHDGKFRHISIKSRNGYKIQARKGYYAPLE